MTVLNIEPPAWMDDELTMLDDAFTRFLEREIAPDYESWVEAGSVSGKPGRRPAPAASSVRRCRRSTVRPAAASPMNR